VNVETSTEDQLAFMTDFKKTISKIEGVGTSSKPPNHWVSTGSLVLNKIISGDFYKGIPQGRISAFVGPSGVGKSFLVGNVVKNAQDDGYFIIILDSENALDDEYMVKIGVNVKSDKYSYFSVSSIQHVVKIISDFVQGYKATYGEDANAPKVLIALDSLDMLATDTELSNFKKGEQKGDQGQKNKQLKAMLKTCVTAIKHINISIVVTAQVYTATMDQKLQGEGTWIVGNAIRYSLSQIIMLTKLKLKAEGGKVGQPADVTGIRMKCEGFKTRFTKPFQISTIEVPYDTGMDPYSGLLPVMVQMGIVTTKGGWNYIPGTDVKFRRTDFKDHVETLLNKMDDDVEFMAIPNDDQYIEDMS